MGIFWTCRSADNLPECCQIRKMKVILDTNIWLSFLLGKRLTTMSRHFKIITKEVGRDNHIETEFIGDVDRAYLTEFFGLREPDVEWFRIEEVQKD